MILIPKPDRREADRLSVPTCPDCRVSDRFLSAVARTHAVIHFRCDVCGYVRIVPKPGNNSPRDEYIPIRGEHDLAMASDVSASPPPDC